MPYTSSQLITYAYYLSGIVSRGTQTVTGEQLADGLDSLNMVIASKSVTYKHIPYFKSVDITANVGQEKYFIPNLLQIENASFVIGSVRYPMFYLDRNSYMGSPRAMNISSLPYSYHFERTIGGSNIYIYFLPNASYLITVWGKFGFDLVEQSTDLSVIWDMFYINYMKFCLAEYLCCLNGEIFSIEARSMLKSMEQKLLDMTPIDFTMKKYSSFVTDNFMGYGIANLGTGFYPT